VIVGAGLRSRFPGSSFAVPVRPKIACHRGAEEREDRIVELEVELSSHGRWFDRLERMS
jgi:hypothetical protein